MWLNCAYSFSIEKETKRNDEEFFEHRFIELEQGYNLTQTQYAEKLEQLYLDLPANNLTLLVRWKSLNCWFLKPHTLQETEDAITLATQYLNEVKHLELNSAVSDFYTCRGRLNSNSGNLTQAFSDFETSIQFAILDQNVFLAADSISRLGVLHIDRGDQGTGIEKLIEAQQYYLAHGDLFWVNHNMIRIADAYSQIGNTNKALEYFQEVEKAQRSAGNIEGAMLAVSYMIDIYIAERQLDKAEDLLQQENSFFSANNDNEALAALKITVGKLYLAQGKLDLAIETLYSALSHYQYSTKLDLLYGIRLNLGKAHIQLGEFEQALSHLLEAEALITQANRPNMLLELLNTKARAYQNIGDYQSAFSALDEYVNQLLINEKFKKQELAARLQIEFDVDKKEQENERLKLEAGIQQSKLKLLNTRRKFQFSGLIISIITLIIAFIIIRKLIKTKQHLHFYANTDVLTRLSNRREILREASNLLVESIKNNKQFSLAILDIDHFKRINDTYGHYVGDDVLKKVAQICKSFTTKSSTIGRIGGEEFLFLFDDLDCKEAFNKTVEINKRISEISFSEIDNALRVTISAGVAELQTDDQELIDIIKRADDALYRAKKAGRNTVLSSDDECIFKNNIKAK